MTTKPTPPTSLISPYAETDHIHLSWGHAPSPVGLTVTDVQSGSTYTYRAETHGDKVRIRVRGTAKCPRCGILTRAVWLPVEDGKPLTTSITRKCARCSLSPWKRWVANFRDEREEDRDAMRCAADCEPCSDYLGDGWCTCTKGMLALPRWRRTWARITGRRG